VFYNLKIALRLLQKNKSISIINIAGLSTGIAICLLLFLWINHEINYDKFHQNKTELFRVIQKGTWNDGNVYGNSIIPYMLTPVLQQEFPEVQDHVRLRTISNAMFQYGDKSFIENEFLLTESSFFNMFSFDLLKGDKKSLLNDEYSIVLSESTARKFFGDEEPLGKVLKYDNESDFTVTGIVADPPDNSSISYSLIGRFSLLGENRINSWSWESQGYIQLKKGTNLAEFSKKISNIMKKYDPINENQVTLQNISRIHLYDDLDEPDQLIYVYIFASIALIILMLGCINFMNLSTARSTKRAKEIGIRKVAGAERKELVYQFLGESLLISYISTIMAIILAEIFLPVFNRISGSNLVISFTNPLTISVILGLATFVGIVSGSYPALVLSSGRPEAIIKGNNHLFSGRKGFRSVLTVFQFTISIALIISVLAVHAQLSYLRKKELGFSRDYIVSIPFNSQIYKTYTSLKNELLKNSNILGVSSSSASPASVGNVNEVTWEGKETDETILFNFLLVEHDFLQFFGLEITEGENFSKPYTEGDLIPYIVNESAVKLMNLKEPVGSKFSMYGNDGIIIGIVKDFHFQSLTQKIGPLLISNLNWWKSSLYVKIKAENIPGTIEFIESKSKEFSPDFPFQYSFLDEEINEQYDRFKNIGQIISYFTFFAVFIACLGLFGLAAFMSEQRTKEIGIRKVFGSNISEIVFLMTKGFVRWVLIANVFAWPLAYFAMNKILRNFVYKINLGFEIFFISGLSALLLGFIVVSFQSLKTASSNPVDTLKHE